MATDRHKLALERRLGSEEGEAFDRRLREAERAEREERLSRIAWGWDAWGEPIAAFSETLELHAALAAKAAEEPPPPAMATGAPDDGTLAADRQAAPVAGAVGAAGGPASAVRTAGPASAVGTAGAASAVGTAGAAGTTGAVGTAGAAGAAGVVGGGAAEIGGAAGGAAAASPRPPHLPLPRFVLPTLPADLAEPGRRAPALNELQLRREVERLSHFHDSVQRSRAWRLTQSLRRLVGRAW